MTVDPAKAGATVEHQGKKYFFCCKHCAAKFQAEPEKYTQPAVDPVCGMKVEPANAAAEIEHAGHSYYFCSKHCAQKFQADPAKYAAKALAPKAPVAAGAKYTCPMHPEIVRDGPGSCPKCGMALVPMVPTVPVAAEYTCPMHPEVRSNRPGNCPKCGMALVRVASAEEDNTELRDHTRRFWVSAVLSVPLVFIAMAPHLGLHGLAPTARGIAEFLLATPVVLWGGWPFFHKFALSLKNRSPNMYTLIGLGVGLAYIYSVLAVFAPGVFPQAFRMSSGEVGNYFEAAAVVVTLVMLGEVLQLRAMGETSKAIRKLLGLAPNTAVRVNADGREFVLADIPGLIEGAHEGAGLGDRFLGHVERCRVLLHLVDATCEHAGKAYKTVRTELEAYGGQLGDKIEIVALNKIDAVDPDELKKQKDRLKRAAKKTPLLISGAVGTGVKEALRALAELIGEAPVSVKAKGAAQMEPWTA